MIREDQDSHAGRSKARYKKDGGDDETRTRDLCRDRAAF